VNGRDATLGRGHFLVKIERPADAPPLYGKVAQPIADGPLVRPELAAKIAGEHGELLRSLGREAEAALHFERQRLLVERAAPKSE